MRGFNPQLIYPPLLFDLKQILNQTKLLPDGYMLGDGAKTPTQRYIARN